MKTSGMVGYQILSWLYPQTKEYGGCTLEIFVFESNLYETVPEKANDYVQSLLENQHNPQLYIDQYTYCMRMSLVFRKGTL